MKHTDRHPTILLFKDLLTNGGHEGKDDKPEPEEHVDLLVDNVDGQDAHGVVQLNTTRATVLLQSALCYPTYKTEGEDKV